MKSDRKLELLACRVAGGSTIKAAAKEIGMSEAAAYAITGGVEFKRRCSEIRTEAVLQAVAILTTGATAAANALVRLLSSEDEKIVLAAAAKLLGSLGPLQELTELRQRIDAIEGQNQSQLRVVK
jgi:HEAT repeat protein